jgi:hypothetical protein
MADISVRVSLKDFKVPAGQNTGILLDTIQGGQPLDTRATCRYVEWTVSFPKAGRWLLQARYSMPPPGAPCYLSINGARQGGVVFSETTRGAALPQWFSYGPFDFNQGENVLRIEPLQRCHPLLWELGFSLDQEASAPTPPVEPAVVKPVPPEPPKPVPPEPPKLVPPKPEPEPSSGDWEKEREELEKKIAVLAEQVKKGGDCDEKVAAIGKQLAERDQKCAADEQKGDALARKIDEQERSNLDQERRLLAQDERIAEQERSNLDQERKLLEQDQKLAGQERSNIDQERRILEQDKRLAEQERNNLDQEKRLFEQDKRLFEQDRKLADVAAKAAGCGECDDKLAARERTIDDLAKKLGDLAKEADAKLGPPPAEGLSAEDAWAPVRSAWPGFEFMWEPGSTEREIADAEARLGVVLPKRVRDLMRVCSGASFPSGDGGAFEAEICLLGVKSWRSCDPELVEAMEWDAGTVRDLVQIGVNCEMADYGYAVVLRVSTGEVLSIEANIPEVKPMGSFESWLLKDRPGDDPRNPWKIYPKLLNDSGEEPEYIVEHHGDALGWFPDTADRKARWKQIAPRFLEAVRRLPRG